jgi:hypothetical protein
MRHLVEMMKEPSPAIFDSIAWIFVHDTQFALPFLGPVIAGFVQGIEHISNNVLLCNYLELIILHCKSHMVPFLDVLKPMLVRNFTKANSIKIGCALSFHLKGEFRNLAETLYPAVLTSLWLSETASFKLLLRFVGFAILFQQQPFEDLLESVEAHAGTLPEMDEDRLASLLEAFSLIIQQRPLGVYSARLTRLGLSLIRSHFFVEIHHFLYNLCVFGHVPLAVIERSCQVLGRPLPDLAVLKTAVSSGTLALDAVPVVT